MRHGTLFIAQSPQPRPANEIYDELFEQVQLVDEVGFEHIWFTEHHFSNYAYVQNPFLMTVHAAALTRRVRFVQGVTILPWWHPLRLAEDIATTDVLTRGRLEIGVGRGYAPHEFTAFNVDAADRRAMYEESLDILFRIWRDGGTITYPQGRFWPIHNTVTVLPEPLQKPHPRVWAAVQSADAMEEAVKHGMVPVIASRAVGFAGMADMRSGYDALLADQGRRFEEFGSLELVCVAETDEEAYAQLEHAYWMLRTARQDRTGTQQLVNGRHHPVPFAGELDPATLRDHLIFGSPDTVIRKLRTAAEHGVTYIVGIFGFGAMSSDTILRSLELYGTEVIPALRDATRIWTPRAE